MRRVVPFSVMGVKRTVLGAALRVAAAVGATQLLGGCAGALRPAGTAAGTATSGSVPGGASPAGPPRSAAIAAGGNDSGSRGGVSWNETAGSIVIANQHVRFRLSKATGAIDSLQLDGQELLGNGGLGYVDLDGSRIGHFTLGRDDRETTAYRIRGGDDFADVTIAHEATAKVPFTIRHHYVLRGEERGVHLCTEVGHSAGLPAAAFDQARFVLRGDPAIFTPATLAVNGEVHPAWTIPAEDSSSVAYRSAASGLYLLRELAFPAEVLRRGANTIAFRLGSGSDNVLYDAIRLEVRRGP